MIERLQQRIERGDYTVGVIGLGYVGLPLTQAFVRQGLPILGFDVDENRVAALNAGRSYLKHIPSSAIERIVADGRFQATTDFARLREADAVLLCIPTPLTRHREPDMSFVEATAATVAEHLRPGHLVVLESTTYPGTTAELVKPVLEATGLVCGKDFYLAYSPEREDPGNIDFETSTIPKVVGGHDDDSFRLARALYGRIVPQVVPVSSLATAEAVKLTENIFRAVNIALVNELKVVFESMDIDVWEVIEAAKSKPFGYMPFYPGPGLGGHCIPIDPFYLTWKAREYDVATRFIELAGEVNTGMPAYVVDRLATALDMKFSTPLNGARILVLGLAYKKNVDDIRESPALRIIATLETRGVRVDYYDPHVAEIPRTREHATLTGRRGIVWSAEALRDYDAALICTDHDDVDYAAVVENCRLVVDTRNATHPWREGRSNVVMA